MDQIARSTAPAPISRRWRAWRRRGGRWARRTAFWPKLEVALAAAAVLIAIASYTFLSASRPAEQATPKPMLFALVAANLLPLLLLVWLVGRRLAALWGSRKRGLAGARLHSRIIALFTVMAVIPTVLVAIFAALLFEFGLQFWFSDRVRTVLDNADQVAQAYVREHQETIRGDILAMAFDLNREAPRLALNPAAMQQFMNLQTSLRRLSEAVMFRSDGVVLARTSLNPELDGSLGVPAADLQRADSGQVVIAGKGGMTDRVQALFKLDGYANTYLFVSREVEPEVLAQVARTTSALSEYKALTQRRRDLQQRFNVVLVTVSLLIVAASVLAGLWFANRLAAPISRLIRAAERVGKGDLGARVAIRNSPDELGVLGRAFNRMTSQLQTQTTALRAANEQLDERRRFTEAVLAGVSAGVLGLDGSLAITLANRSACELLDTPEADLAGKPLAQAVPEIAAVAAATASFPVEAQVAVTRRERPRTLLVRIAEEAGGRDAGFVVSFDDITDQIANQRRAAWSDVARRIAHEIRNPLTPIQLAAERLRRRYGQQVMDPEGFAAYTDTIIRQVGDLRRMLDEFSAFARMPKPQFQPEAVVDILKEALFLQDVGNPAVDFTFQAPDVLPPLVCDRRQISQAVINLLKNAAEATQARADLKNPEYRAVVGLAVIAGEDTLIIRVSDNGVGLPADGRDRLTEPYVTTRVKGTGLGLAIVKKIAEDHMGALELRDAPGGGAIVSLTLRPSLLQQKLTAEPAGAATETRVSHGA